MHIDEKFKDATPKDTVKRIKDILDNFGITVTEKWKDSGITNCYSMHLCVEGTNLFSNGKGVTEDLARASAYAEFIERLQAGAMGLGHIDYKDAVLLTKDELLQKDDSVLATITETIKNTTNTEFSTDKLISYCLNSSADGERIRCIPFYDINRKKKVYLPVTCVELLYITNGMAAGNSPEEALVQGFAEVVERYYVKVLYAKKLTPPTIPDDFLKKFDTAYSIITDIRKAGYSVVIKDCSLGNEYPVVAAILIDKRTHTYHVHLGASPVFEIALERSLTETFQGRDINSATSVRNIITGSQNNSSRDMFMSYRFGNIAYPVEFFSSKESYAFHEPEVIENSDNKQLLSKSLQFAQKMNWRVLIRDISHLGFNTFRIIVPGISEVDCSSFLNLIPVNNIFKEVKDARQDITKATPDQLYLLRIAYNLIQTTNCGLDPVYSRLAKIPLAVDKKEDTFLGYMFMAYVEWELRNKKLAYELAKTAQRYATNECDINYLSVFNRLNDSVNDEYSYEYMIDIMYQFYDNHIVSEIEQTHYNNGNPFEKYMTKCLPDDCSRCRYVDKCLAKTNKMHTDRLNSFVAEFDNDKAFERIQSVISAVQNDTQNNSV